MHGFLGVVIFRKDGQDSSILALSSRGENKTKASPTRLKKETIVEVTWGELRVHFGWIDLLGDHA